ncbi:TonB-dependent receptor plug domain-containing protein [Bizionia sp. KMM 8389]
MKLYYKNVKQLLFFLCCYLCAPYFIYAQDSTIQKHALTKVLKEIETHYRISFSYANTTVENIQLISPEKSLDTAEIITYLERKTHLVYDKLDSKTYVIRPVIFSDITKTQFLDEVLLSKYLTQGISVQTDGRFHLNLADFNILPGLIEADILQSIQALPGIVSTDERVSNLNIRGGTNDQNLILWNGIKMYQSGHFFGLISAFNPSIISSVEISKNGTSSQFGDGISGIINMSSSSETPDKLTGSIGINMLAADVFADIPISKKASLKIAGRRSLTDAFSTPTYKQYFKRIFQDSDLSASSQITVNNEEQFYFYDLSAQLQLNISKRDQLEISFLTIDNTLNYEENASSLNSRSRLSQKSVGLSALHTRNWNSKFKTSLQAYYSSYDLFADQVDLYNNQGLVQENAIRDSGIKLHALYNLNPRLNYFGGYQYSEIGVGNLEDVSNPDYKRYIKNVLRSHALFSELTYESKSGSTRAKFGLRSNYIEKFGTFNLEPRMSFNQTLGANFKFEVLAEIKHQQATQIIDLQQDFLGIEKKRWMLYNNADIPLIKSKQVSTGVHYSRKGWLISLEGYLKDVDGISSRSQGFQNQFQYTNTVGSYTVNGLDFLINKQFSHLSTWFSYSYSKNTYTFPELNTGTPFPNNVDIRHQMNLSTTYNVNRLKLALGINWHSGKPTTIMNYEASEASNTLIFETANASTLPNYWRCDFSANYDFNFFKNTKAQMGASVWNIFNTENIINQYYIENVDQEIIEVKNTALGITPNISFRVFF